MRWRATGRVDAEEEIASRLSPMTICRVWDEHPNEQHDKADQEGYCHDPKYHADRPHRRTLSSILSLWSGCSLVFGVCAIRVCSHYVSLCGDLVR